MEYRREIDGLRAVAVLAVVLFHAGFAPFAGGFVGVDVFFVLSGYLITTLVVRDVNEGVFSTARFYERRVRRILPALVTVCIATSLAALCWMLPDELTDYGESLVATALFVSNFYFANETGYFGADPSLFPLLHTWSLAIEEQYYLVTPLAVVLIARAGLRSLGLVLVLAFAASFGFAVWLTVSYPENAFFHTGARVWEILAGALAALALLANPGLGRMPDAVKEVLASAGLAMIVVAIFSYREDLPFPGIPALLPIAGAVLFILFADGSTAVGRLLSTRPMVGIGLVSYGAYLWHQPLFSFARLHAGTTLDASRQFLLIGATFGLAYLSWRIVETPFRRRSFGGRWAVFGMAILGVALLVAAGAYGQASRGVLQRFEGPERGFHEAMQSLQRYASKCRWQALLGDGDGGVCLVGNTDASPSLIVWGDSHAEVLRSGLDEALAARDMSAVVISRSGCPPLSGTTYAPGDDKGRRCEADVKKDIERIESKGTTPIVIAAHWSFYRKNERYFTAGTADNANDCARVDGSPYQSAVAETVCRLVRRGRDVFVMRNVPQLTFNPIDQLYDRETALWKPVDILIPRSPVDDGLDALASSTLPVRLIDPADALCGTDSQECVVSREGVPYYRDDNHLSGKGSSIVGEWLVELVAEGSMSHSEAPAADF